MNTFKKLLMVIFVLITFACQKEQTKDIGKIINEVQDEFAPDSRTAIFDISYEKSAGKNILKGETYKEATPL